MVAEFFGNLGSQLLGGLFGSQANAQGVLLSAEQQKGLMNHQAKTNWKYYQKELLNRWQLARQGLEKGNYNPMLALQGINGNSNWASQASISDTGAGQAFNAGVGNALTMQQVRQQGELNASTIGLNNSQSVLNEEKANTELYTQIEKANHSDMLKAQATLASKQASYEDKRQAWEQLKYSKEVEELGSRIKLNNQAVLLRQSEQRLNNTLNASNSEDVHRKRIENQKLDNYYNHPNPKVRALRQTLYDFGQNLRDAGISTPRYSVTPRK